MDVLYRVKQFLRASTARRAVSQQRGDGATGVLNPRAQLLFFEQAPQDQRHALAVYGVLEQAGQRSEDLLAAALLHDVGKSLVPFRPWQRGLFTLAEYVAPRALERANRGSATGLRRRLWQYAHHASIGADLAEEAGCSPVTVRLILRHEDRLEMCQTGEDRWLAALQAADDVS